MPFNSSTNFLHSDIIVFGAAGTAGVLWRNATTGKLQVISLGTANSGKLLGVNASGDLELQSPATFSLADDAVTFAKMQNIATATLLGRATAGAGDPEALTPTQARTLLGLGTVATLNTGSNSGDIPVLTTGGFLPTSMIPPLRSHEFVEVANQAARLALTAAQVQPGDEAYQSDTLETYKLIATDPSLAASWRLISDMTLPGSAITSGTVAVDRLGANGQSGRILSYDNGWIVPPAGKDPLSVLTANGSLSANSRVYSNGTSRLSLALPTSAAQGSQIDLTDISTNGWRVTQAAGQQIFFADGSSSTSGTGGYIESALGDGITTPRSRYCNVLLECIAANNTWLVKTQNSIVTYV